MAALGIDFFARDSDVVAVELVGQVLVFEQGGTRLSGMVVETEAYFGSEDPASHAYRGKTPRNGIMFGRAGISYVYLNYGSCYLLNVVTREAGAAGAVLIRALEPLEGIEVMRKGRRESRLEALTSGPGKLTQAFGITKDQNGWDMTGGLLRFEENPVLPDILTIKASRRVGISRGKNLLYRFYVKGNPFVSKK
ncbi:MAG: DNA-3-methyladenine glycosylase [Candidatus Omnitrophica bacterium]|nr:DNA-3-methyladenine glycosylase [Candidatus Omnitrophota bacterium]